MTPRRVRFVEEYLARGNATQAAVAAGYSAATANREGYRLLRHPEVAAELEARRKSQQQQRERAAAAQMRAHLQRQEAFATGGHLSTGATFDPSRDAQDKPPAHFVPTPTPDHRNDGRDDHAQGGTMPKYEISD